jgi:hypothetical protein
MYTKRAGGLDAFRAILEKKERKESRQFYFIFVYGYKFSRWSKEIYQSHYLF